MRPNPCALAVSDKQLRDTARPGELVDRVDGVVAFQNLDPCSRGLGSRQLLVKGRLIRGGDLGLVDVDSD